MRTVFTLLSKILELISVANVSLPIESPPPCHINIKQASDLPSGNNKRYYVSAGRFRWQDHVAASVRVNIGVGKRRLTAVCLVPPQRFDAIAYTLTVQQAGMRERTEAMHFLSCWR